MGVLHHPLTYCIIAAIGFGIWPVGARLSRLPMDWALVFLSIGALVGVLVPFRPAGWPAWHSVGVFTCMSVIPNAIALVLVGVLLGWKGQDVSRWIPTLNVMMPIVTVIAGAMLLGEPLTAKKLAGIGVACVSIYLLSTP